MPQVQGINVTVAMWEESAYNTIPGSLVFEYRNRPPVVLTLASQAEFDITGAILRLESARTPTVCWAAGDGERSYQNSGDQSGYSRAKEVLQQSNYASQQLLLSQRPQVPTTCDVLAIVGPTAALDHHGAVEVAEHSFAHRVEAAVAAAQAHARRHHQVLECVGLVGDLPGVRGTNRCRHSGRRAVRPHRATHRARQPRDRDP